MGLVEGLEGVGFQYAVREDVLLAACVVDTDGDVNRG